MTQDTALARPDEIPANPLRAVFSPYLWLAGVQLATDWIAAVLGAVAVAAILLAGIIGSPLALLGVPVTRWVITCLNAISGIERTRLALTLGVEIAAPQLPTRVDETWRDSRDLLGGGMLWRQICYWTILLGWSMVTAADLMLALAMPGTFALMPIYYSAAGWPEDLPFSGGSVAWTICALAFAVLFFISPHLIRLGAHLDASLADNLIGPSATGELVQRVGQLESSRARVVDSAEQERRRIERDLHDGAQQRLVSLAMTLGRAKSRLATDTDPATRQLLDEAHAEAKLAITEIRDLTRGLHPPVLTDRGLDAALSAVAARSPVPVQVQVDVHPRPSSTIEAIAYFVVTEALTNVAKHAQASRATVAIGRHQNLLRVTVVDDGRGGADPARGTGLAGLADRVSGVDGRLDVVSPPGGPTVLTVEVPCG